MRYCNFPIQLLQGFLRDSEKCLEDVMIYAIYAHSTKLELGDEVKTIESAAKYLGIEIEDAVEVFHKGQALHEKLPKKSPHVGLRIPILFDFYHSKKSEFEKLSLLAFLSIKSILGDKAYCKMVNLFWFSRMDGKIKSVQGYHELSSELQKYGKEYWTRKIKIHLTTYWGLKTYALHTRGFYVTFKLDKESLIFEVEKRRLSYLQKKEAMETKETLKKVLEKLKGSPN